jgi:hypothetical protein
MYLCNYIKILITFARDKVKLKQKSMYLQDLISKFGIFVGDFYWIYILLFFTPHFVILLTDAALCTKSAYRKDGYYPSPSLQKKIVALPVVFQILIDVPLIILNFLFFSLRYLVSDFSGVFIDTFSNYVLFFYIVLYNVSWVIFFVWRAGILSGEADIKNILIEFHGLFFDLIVLGMLFSIYSIFVDKKKEKEELEKELRKYINIKKDDLSQVDKNEISFLANKLFALKKNHTKLFFNLYIESIVCNRLKKATFHNVYFEEGYFSDIKNATFHRVHFKDGSLAHMKKCYFSYSLFEENTAFSFNNCFFIRAIFLNLIELDEPSIRTSNFDFCLINEHLKNSFEQYAEDKYKVLSINELNEIGKNMGQIIPRGYEDMKIDWEKLSLVVPQDYNNEDAIVTYLNKKYSILERRHRQLGIFYY